MTHPSLFFTKTDIDNYKNRILSDAKLKEKYEAATKDAKKLLADEFVSEDYANGRKSLHGNFWDIGRQTSAMAMCLGTKYLIEGDEKCAEKLKKLLAHFCSFERWHAESYSVRTPVPWHSDLCSVSMAIAAATVYDFIYDALTTEEKELFADRILHLGVMSALGDWVLPETRIHAVDSMGHNWWAVCIGDAATALLAIKDDLKNVDTDGILDSTNRALAAYFSYKGNVLFNKFGNYDASGLFYESIGYFEYGTATPLRYLDCYERTIGRNEVLRAAIPENLGDALLSFSYPYSKDGKTEYAFFDFGDSDFDRDCTFLVKELIKTGYGNSTLRTYAKTGGTDLYEDIAGFSTDFDDDKISLKKTAFFPSGYVVTRENWEPDSTALAIKSGYCWNHSHNDSGSFIIAYKGKPIIIDSACCGYDNKLYHPFYCQDDAHSVIKIGGEGRRHEELYRGTKFPGGIIDSAEDEDCLFVQADCTGPMAHLCSRLYRNYFWFDNSVLVIFDEIYCHEEKTAEFSLHYAGHCTQDGTVFRIDDGDNHAVLTPVFPEGLIYSEKTGYAPHKPEETVPYLELQTAEKARKHLIITVLSLGENTPTIEFIHEKDCDGVKLVSGELERRIWFNNMADGHVMHDNSNTFIEGFETDAYMLAITENKLTGTSKVLSVCSSYLRKDGKVISADFIKKTDISKLS